MTQAAPQSVEFVAAVIHLARPAFCSLELFKEVKALKKSRETKLPFDGKIEKREIFKSIGIASDYESSVNRHRQAAATAAEKPTYEVFEAESLAWGQWLPNSRTIISHTKKGETNEELYVRFYKHRNTTCEVTWYLNGAVVEKDSLKEWLPADELETESKINGSERQELAEEDRVKPFTAALRNIVECTVNGTKYLPFA
jgi:hypothetical protein